MSAYMLFFIPPLVLMLFAQWRVNSAFSRYSKIANMQGLTGLAAARRLLDEQALGNVSVEMSKGGKLSDHYDPRSKVLRLSPEVANKASVAALGIVAHEVGHAVQDARAYGPMRLRSVIYPVANIGSNFGFILVFLGLLLASTSLTWVGVWLFAAAVVFTIVTLPVEFNASARAREMLTNTGLVSGTESVGVSAVLSAAALTYVAALVQAVFQLLYFITLAGGGRRD